MIDGSFRTELGWCDKKHVWLAGLEVMMEENYFFKGTLVGFVVFLPLMVILVFSLWQLSLNGL